MDGWESPCGCWELFPGPVQEQKYYQLLSHLCSSNYHFCSLTASFAIVFSYFLFSCNVLFLDPDFTFNSWFFTYFHLSETFFSFSGYLTPYIPFLFLSFYTRVLCFPLHALIFLLESHSVHFHLTFLGYHCLTSLSILHIRNFLSVSCQRIYFICSR